jgi:hypothetical protein
MTVNPSIEDRSHAKAASGAGREESEEATKNLFRIVEKKRHEGCSYLSRPDRVGVSTSVARGNRLLWLQRAYSLSHSR